MHWVRSIFCVAATAAALSVPRSDGFAQAADFIRGDANDDTVVSLADSVFLGRYLFYGGRPPACMKSADIDDDGQVDISDEIDIANVVILGEPAPPAPFPNPGPDETEDDLPCTSYGDGGPLVDPAARVTVLDASAPGGDDRFATIRIAISNTDPVLGAGGVIRIDPGVVFRAERPTDLTGRSENDGFTRAAVVGDELRFGVSGSITGDPAAAFPAGEDNAILEIRVCLKEGTTAGEYPLALVSGELVALETAQRIDAATGSATLTVERDLDEGVGCRFVPVPPVVHPENPADVDAVFMVGDGAGVPGGTVDVPLILGSNGVIQAFSFSVDFDEDVLQGLSIDPVYELPSGEEYAFSVYTVNNDTRVPGSRGVDEGYLVGAAVFHFNDFSNSLAPSDGTDVLNFRMTIHPDTTESRTELRFIDGAVGEGQPVRNAMTVGGMFIEPEVAGSFVFIDGFLQIVGDVSFFRGDSNQDRRIDIADGIHTLDYLFANGAEPLCLDAADADDSGAVNLADPVAVFAYLFSGEATLAAPVFPDCGIDLTPDDLPACDRERTGCE